MAELSFFAGTMDCGKSTLALQMDHNHRARGRAGLIFTRLDRSGEAVLSSRLGLETPAIEVATDLDIWEAVVAHLTAGGRVDYLI
ncbi:thymidine kinase, partial [Janibacter sp. RAF20_2_2]